jgi:hypothetical protein
MKIAVQNALENRLSDAPEPPKTTLGSPYFTTTYARLSAGYESAALPSELRRPGFDSN